MDVSCIMGDLMMKGLAIVTAAAALSARLLAAPQVADVPAGAQPDAAAHNALVRKHCVVCHQGANPGGGLSLETFDFRRPDAALARMMAIKIKDDGAMTAAGVAKPDPATFDGFMAALSAAGAAKDRDGWTVDLDVDPKAPSRGHSLVVARSMRTVSEPRGRGLAEYRLTLACNGATRDGTMQIATYGAPSPDATTVARTMPGGGVAVPFSYAVDGSQKQPAALSPTSQHTGSAGALSPFPTHTLTIADLFPSETVSFSFDGLSPSVRQVLATCALAPSRAR
jgi:mono/diheme cytochrome c family protein